MGGGQDWASEMIDSTQINENVCVVEYPAKCFRTFPSPEEAAKRLFAAHVPLSQAVIRVRSLLQPGGRAVYSQVHAADCKDVPSLTRRIRDALRQIAEGN